MLYVQFKAIPGYRTSRKTNEAVTCWFYFVFQMVFRQNALCDDRRTPVSFVTKWGSRISRERLDLESPNSTNTSTPTCWTTAPDLTSLAASGLQLFDVLKKRSKIPSPTASGLISGERFERRARKFTHLSGTVSSTKLPGMGSLAVSSRLQNLIKYCTKVRKNGCGRHRGA